MDKYFKNKYLYSYLTMTDTPLHIKQLQLKIWLAKTPQERLLQYLTDNDALYKGIMKIKGNLQQDQQKAPLNNN